jgi:CSLREA domain-containing protein
MPSRLRSRSSILLGLLLATAATLACLLSASAASAAMPTKLTVTTTNDELNQNGLCSLREAIVQTNGGGPFSGCAAGPAPYTINLAKNAIYTLTITGTGEDGGLTGDLDVSSQVKLNGNKAVLSAGPSAYNGIDRALDVQSSGNLTVNKLTVRNGQAPANSGGGIRSLGSTTVVQSTVIGNSANQGGGAAGNLALSDTTVSGNLAVSGGGIYGGTATLTNTTVSGNSASGSGGGVLVDGSATLTKTTVSGNFASFDGGGLYVGGTATLTNTTVSGNSIGAVGNLGLGGGIYLVVLSTANLLNVTVTDNSTFFGGAAGIFRSHASTLNAEMTIVAKQRVGISGDQGNDCAHDDSGFYFGSSSYNIDSDRSCWNSCGCTTNEFDGTGDQQGVSDAALNLGPLANNGGPTQTHALLFPSVAIDAGNNADAPPTDQRNVGRPQDGDGNGTKVADIGAYERKK